MDSKRTEIPVEVRKNIIELSKKGFSLRKIGDIVRRSHASVQTVIRNYRNRGSVENKARCGRPPKLSDRERRHIIRKVNADPRITATELALDVANTSGNNVHPITVRRLLHNHGFESRTARKKPFISRVNEQKRLEFATLHRNKDSTFWNTVLFTDESKFNVFQCDGQQKVWRKRNESWKKRNLVPSVKYGGGNVLVWGCMSGAGVGNLVFIEGIMDKWKYLTILKENLKQSAEKLGLGRDWVFQQDNDPKHTAIVVKEWLLYNVPKQLHSPPQSPDMNPIEHLWGELKRRIKKYNIKSKDDLKEALVKEWNNFTPAYTKKLVESMPRRLEAVIEAEGGNTKY